MIKRPLDPRFTDAVLDGRKFTTIRNKPWPVWTDVMLYNWSGKPYRSKQINVAPVLVESEREILISNDGDMVSFYPDDVDGIPLYRTEGFVSHAELQDWFGKLVKPGEMVTKHLMQFRRLPVDSDQEGQVATVSSRSSVDDWIGDFCMEGWITRAGKFLPCDREWLHGHVAKMALGGENAEYRAERMGWVRISEHGESCSKPLSQKQRDTLFDWAEAMGFDYADIAAAIEGLSKA